MAKYIKLKHGLRATAQHEKPVLCNLVNERFIKMEMQNNMTNRIVQMSIKLENLLDGNLTEKWLFFRRKSQQQIMLCIQFGKISNWVIKIAWRFIFYGEERWIIIICILLLIFTNEIIKAERKTLPEILNNIRNCIHVDIFCRFFLIFSLTVWENGTF